MQSELAALSPEGELIVATRSHHRIAEDQPALVARAIDRVVAAARRGRRPVQPALTGADSYEE